MDAKIWHEFGLDIGVPLDFLEQLKGYPDNECLIEVADHWLRNHPDNPTWDEVENVVKKFPPATLNLSDKAKEKYDVPGNNITIIITMIIKGPEYKVFIVTQFREIVDSR